MLENDTIGKNKIYQLGKELGLEKEDIDEVMKISLKGRNGGSVPPIHPMDTYSGGSYYGAISIKDFRKLKR